MVTLAKSHHHGEDPHTLWALTDRLDVVLSQLDDPTPQSEALVIYRPSFGRRGASKRSRAGRRAEFGEFDAIIRSNAAAYFVEGAVVLEERFVV